MHGIILSYVLAAVIAQCPPREIDDSYATAIRGMRVASEDGRPVTGDIAQMVALWREYPAFNRVRVRAQELGAAPTAQLRVEIGSPSANDYRVFWIIVVGKHVHGLSLEDGSVTDRSLSPAWWEKLEAWMRTNRVWQLASDGDFDMHDGTAYFVSLCLPDGAGQHVLYAPVLGTLTQSEARRSFAQRTRIQDELLRRALQPFFERGSASATQLEHKCGDRKP